MEWIIEILVAILLLVCGVVTHIYGEVVDVLVEVAEYTQIVRRSILRRSYGVFADVATENYALVALADALYNCLQTLRCEADTVDYSLVCREFENARFRVALLWAWSYCSNLYKAKTESRQWSINLAIAVVARCNTDRVAEMKAEHLSLQTLILDGVNTV